MTWFCLTSCAIIACAIIASQPAPKVVEDDGSTPPQFHVDLDLPTLDVCLRRRQYHNLLSYGASLNRLAKQLVVRDIRPSVPVKHNAQVCRGCTERCAVCLHANRRGLKRTRACTVSHGVVAGLVAVCL